MRSLLLAKMGRICQAVENYWEGKRETCSQTSWSHKPLSFSKADLNSAFQLFCNTWDTDGLRKEIYLKKKKILCAWEVQNVPKPDNISWNACYQRETTKSTGLILIKSLTHILKNDFSPQILIFHGYFESCNSYHLFGQVILMSVCLAE